METKDIDRISATMRQLQILWLAFIASSPFSTIVLLVAIPPQSPPAGLMFAVIGALSGFPALPLAARYRRVLDAYTSGSADDASLVQRALVFGAVAAETPMLVGVVQYALQANALALLLLSGLSFGLMLLLRPRRP